jgi:hypothetical protein
VRVRKTRAETCHATRETAEATASGRRTGCRAGPRGTALDRSGSRARGGISVSAAVVALWGGGGGGHKKGERVKKFFILIDWMLCRK